MGELTREQATFNSIVDHLCYVPRLPRDGGYAFNSIVDHLTAIIPEIAGIVHDLSIL